jgi:hypothetical protein
MGNCPDLRPQSGTAEVGGRAGKEQAQLFGIAGGQRILISSVTEISGQPVFPISESCTTRLAGLFRLSRSKYKPMRKQTGPYALASLAQPVWLVCFAYLAQNISPCGNKQGLMPLLKVLSMKHRGKSFCHRPKVR